MKQELTDKIKALATDWPQAERYAFASKHSKSHRTIDRYCKGEVANMTLATAMLEAITKYHAKVQKAIQ